MILNIIKLQSKGMLLVTPTLKGFQKVVEYLKSNENMFSGKNMASGTSFAILILGNHFTSPGPQFFHL